ncbi:rRNA accumulation- protein [Blomia tropicalis]|nr:rRNA accumulation- protein [Blomia tropicalis]
MSETNLFKRAISVTIENWPSFQIAVRDGMGGTDTPAKLEWMNGVIMQLFETNGENLMVQDVVDYVSEIIDNEFDTIIEDGSTEMICSSITAYYNHIRKGDLQFVMEKLESFNKKTSYAVNAETVYQIEKTDNEFSSTVTDESIKINNIEMDNAKPEDDGWTVVRRKR